MASPNIILLASKTTCPYSAGQRARIVSTNPLTANSPIYPKAIPANAWGIPIRSNNANHPRAFGLGDLHRRRTDAAGSAKDHRHLARRHRRHRHDRPHAATNDRLLAAAAFIAAAGFKLNGRPGQEKPACSHYASG